MGSGFAADADQIRAHASTVDAIRARFEAVKGASAYIAQDDRAYGVLCGWISAVLEGRHRRQDELIAYVEENLSLVVDGLHRTVEAYAASEADNAAAMRGMQKQLGA